MSMFARVDPEARRVFQATTAVIIPCYNEEITIAKVVSDFKIALPDADIYVFDNNSTDDSARLASGAGAKVIYEKRQGKGYVVASMLNLIAADYYIMVDGDDTYPANRAKSLLQPLLDGQADMVVGQRLSTYTKGSFRPLHVFGNKLVRNLINTIFSEHQRLVDIMSGYRAFTREVALNLPVVASGFDVETEMTIQLLYRRFVIREVAISYATRPTGSTSKLRTFYDGIRVLLKIFGIFKAYKPLTFFGSLAIAFGVLGTALGVVVVTGHAGYSYVVLLAALAASSVLLSFLFVAVGVILHTLNFRILEMTNVLGKQISHLKRDQSDLRSQREKSSDKLFSPNEF